MDCCVANGRARFIAAWRKAIPRLSPSSPAKDAFLPASSARPTKADRPVLITKDVTPGAEHGRGLMVLAVGMATRRACLAVGTRRRVGGVALGTLAVLSDGV